MQEFIFFLLLGMRHIGHVYDVSIKQLPISQPRILSRALLTYTLFILRQFRTLITKASRKFGTILYIHNSYNSASCSIPTQLFSTNTGYI